MALPAESELPLSSISKPDAPDIPQQDDTQAGCDEKKPQDSAMASEPESDTVESDLVSQSKLKGARFALLFACILFANFLIGYVRLAARAIEVSMLTLPLHRTPAV